MKIFYIFFLFVLTLLQAQNDEMQIKEKLIFLKDKPSFDNTYINQIIPVNIEVIIAEDNFDLINSEFIDSGNGVDIISKNLTWYLLEENTFLLTYYIKIKNEHFKIPDIITSVTREGATLDSLTTNEKELKSKKAQKNSRFCNVIAKKIIVKNHKISKYNEVSNIIALELESTLGNLEDFSLPFVKEQGVDWINIELPITKIFYYAIIPNSIKTIEFNYFNPEIEEFNKLQVNFDFSKFDQKTSTQIEINPNKKNFPYLRTIVISLLILAFLVLFLVRKRYFYLIVAILIGLFLAYLSKENTIVIKGGTNIYLLPTKNSSVFYTTDFAMETELLKKKSGYYKILLPDEKIGWIKESDVFKN